LPYAEAEGHVVREREVVRSAFEPPHRRGLTLWSAHARFFGGVLPERNMTAVSEHTASEGARCALWRQRPRSVAAANAVGLVLHANDNITGPDRRRLERTS
jgi:hypothetical protein